jgi:FKBP-type peptidyl-prolyl cis-trans isomerase
VEEAPAYTGVGTPAKDCFLRNRRPSSAASRRKQAYACAANHNVTLMKPSFPILAGLLAIAAPLGAQNLKINLDPNQPAQPAPAAKPAAKPAASAAAPAEQKEEIIQPVDGKYNDAQKMEMYGFIVGDQLRLAQFRAFIRSEEEFDGFVRGLAQAVAGHVPNYDTKVLGPQTEELVKTRGAEVNAAMEKARAEANEKNQKDAVSFLAELDKKSTVKKTSSGLRYEIIQEGKGAKAKADQAVSAYLTSSITDGRVFNTTKGKDGKDVAIDIPVATAMPGLKEGLQLVGVGGKIKLYIPAELWLGDKGPLPGALTIHEIEIIDVKDAPKQP